ncbi:MAG: MFS transporter [Bacteroidales bacterium]|nr:MFS transporter [Bacteroidales bacterium]
MAAEYPNYPFYKWVPKPLGIIFMIILFVPMLTMSGVYSANSGEMMSGLGIQTEYITFAGFCTSIGMAAFSPFFYQLVCIRREKMMLLVGFGILYGLSYVCASTSSLFVLGLCSLVMGFVRQTLMMAHLFVLIKYAFGIEATRNITPGNEPTTEEAWDAMDTEKMVSQPVIYLFFMIIGQLSTWLTAWLAYTYEWQYVYYFMMAFMLAGILIVMFTMPYHQYAMPKFPITFSKLGNVMVFSIMLCSFAYVMVFGKTLDWFDDASIRLSTFVCVVFTLLFIYLEMSRKSPYFIMEVFKIRVINYGILLFFLLMVCNSSAMFVNIFTNVGMKIDNWQNATLGNWVMLGYFIGTVFAIIASAKHIHLKWMYALGFVLIGAYALFMFYEVQNDGLYERMKWPIILRSTGMMALYALISTIANQRMPYRFLSTWVCIMLSVRMVIAPCIGSALYTNVFQQRQQYYVARFAQDFDRTNIEAARTYDQTVRGMQYQGKTETEAQNMAAMSLKGKVQVQATLTAIKEMSAWTFYLCMACALLMFILPWRKRNLRELTPEYLMRGIDPSKLGVK